MKRIAVIQVCATERFVEVNKVEFVETAVDKGMKCVLFLSNIYIYI